MDFLVVGTGVQRRRDCVRKRAGRAFLNLLRRAKTTERAERDAVARGRAQRASPRLQSRFVFLSPAFA